MIPYIWKFNLFYLGGQQDNEGKFVAMKEIFEESTWHYHVIVYERRDDQKVHNVLQQFKIPHHPSSLQIWYMYLRTNPLISHKCFIEISHHTERATRVKKDESVFLCQQSKNRPG